MPLEVIAPMLMITAPLSHFIDPVVILRVAQALLQAIRQRHRADRRRTSGTPLSRRQSNRARLAQARGSAPRTVCELFPIMRSATIVRAWAGIEARMPDDIPVIGPSARSEGVYHQFGFSAHGFQLGPGVGALMAELVATGATNLPIAPFRVDRFKDGLAATDH